jgi:hypothetical protein
MFPSCFKIGFSHPVTVTSSSVLMSIRLYRSMYCTTSLLPQHTAKDSIESSQRNLVFGFSSILERERCVIPLWTGGKDSTRYLCMLFQLIFNDAMSTADDNIDDIYLYVSWKECDGISEYLMLLYGSIKKESFHLGPTEYIVTYQRFHD